MDEKLKFIARYLEGEKISPLCKEFGITRPTAYKLIDRYKMMGQCALVEQKRTPHRYANALPIQVEAMILDLKREYPSWGAPKIRDKIIKKYPEVKTPAKSTIHAILDRHGLVKYRLGRKRFKSQGTLLEHVTEPNQLWCADYKGEFMLGNQQYCYPLTITDYASRYIIAVDALSSTREEFAFEVFTRAFKEFGVPDSMRTDNGNPFANGQSFYNLTKLSVWWMRHGINLERITPGEPQENGRHERMHLTLKLETTRPPRTTLVSQQEAFDDFQNIFNNERPHEGIKNKYPSEIYRKSDRSYKKLEPLFYPMHDQTITVTQCGRICTKTMKVSLSMDCGRFIGVEQPIV